MSDLSDHLRPFKCCSVFINADIKADKKSPALQDAECLFWFEGEASIFTVKTLVSGSSILEYETKTGIVGILVIFQGIPMFNHINEKLSPRPFK